MTPSSSRWASSVVRHLYTQNPFYLIGTLLILFGLQRAVGSAPELATSGLLTGLLVGYTLLIAAIAAVVVRWGHVWDDARTILLVIVLLFFMLSTSLDVHLIYHPIPGSCLLLGGLLFAIGLCEALLRGLRIGLAAQYRLPLYLILALLFLYPIVPTVLHHLFWREARSWTLFAFPSVAAVVLLTLLPAARTPAWREPATGTPWQWPYYPWSLFVYLTIGIAIRTWWLTLSFEPEKGYAAFFQPYFLFPLCLAWSALVLEIGRARDSLAAIATGLVLPLCGLAVGFPVAVQTEVQAVFVNRLGMTLGSPAQLVLASMGLYYGWAWLRGLAAAEGLLWAVGLLLAFVGRQTDSWSTLAAPQPLVLAAMAGMLLLSAVYRESTWRALASGTLVVAAFLYTGGGLAEKDAWFWQGHAPLLGLLAVAAIFRDDLAQWLRQFAWPLTPALALVAALAYPVSLPMLSETSLASLLAVTLLLSLGYWQRQPEVPLLGAAMVTLTANALTPLRHAYSALGQTLLAEGLPWLAGGLAVVALALAISLLKMGLWDRGQVWLDRTNAALRGLASGRPGSS